MAHHLLADSNSNSPCPAAPMCWLPVEMNFLPCNCYRGIQQIELAE